MLSLLDINRMCDNIVFRLNRKVKGICYWKDNTSSDEIQFFIDYQNLLYYFCICYEDIPETPKECKNLIETIIKDYTKVILKQYIK